MSDPRKGLKLIAAEEQSRYRRITKEQLSEVLRNHKIAEPKKATKFDLWNEVKKHNLAFPKVKKSKEPKSEESKSKESKSKKGKPSSKKPAPSEPPIVNTPPSASFWDQFKYKPTKQPQPQPQPKKVPQTVSTKVVLTTPSSSNVDCKAIKQHVFDKFKLSKKIPSETVVNEEIEKFINESRLVEKISRDVLQQLRDIIQEEEQPESDESDVDLEQDLEKELEEEEEEEQQKEEETESKVPIANEPKFDVEGLAKVEKLLQEEMDNLYEHYSKLYLDNKTDEEYEAIYPEFVESVVEDVEDLLAGHLGQSPGSGFIHDFVLSLIPDDPYFNNMFQPGVREQIERDFLDSVQKARREKNQGSGEIYERERLEKKLKKIIKRNHERYRAVPKTFLKKTIEKLNEEIFYANVLLTRQFLTPFVDDIVPGSNIPLKTKILNKWMDLNREGMEARENVDEEQAQLHMNRALTKNEAALSNGTINHATFVNNLRQQTFEHGSPGLEFLQNYVRRMIPDSYLKDYPPHIRNEIVQTFENKIRDAYLHKFQFDLA